MTREPDIDQPGLRRLREAVSGFVARRAPSGSTIRSDAIAGLTVTVSVVPDGMANGLLAGVNPVFGLYSNMVAPIVGGFLTSSRLMVINSTSAAALVAGQALGALAPGERGRAMFFVVAVAGVLSIGLGLLRLGRLTRFVSFSVMTGFIAGIAVVLVLSQLSTITGVASEGANAVAKTVDLASRLAETHLASVAMAALTLALASGLARTPLSKVAGLVAIAVPTAVVAIAGLDGVALVSDIGKISGGFPSPFVPSASDVTVGSVTAAASVAVIVLVQGAGVSQSVPNPDGSRGDASRDFVAQGAANVAAGLFRGLPVGGSLGGTALNVVSGGVSRWAGILSGAWMAAIVLGIPGIIARVAMPSLGALLIIAAINSLHPSDIASVWRAGWPSRLAATTTFVSTLFLPIQVAVALGVVLSVMMYVSESSTDISLVELIERDDGRVEERDPPDRLSDDTVTVLDVYGRLFFAGARTLERLLPEVPEDIDHPVVILRLRGKTNLGATVVEALSNYAEQLRSVDGRLYVTGLGDEALEHLLRTGKFRRRGDIRVYEAEPIVMEATRRARDDAEGWLVGLHRDGPDADG